MSQFPPQKILVVDDNTDNGALLVRTLSRKFPAAGIVSCVGSWTAARLVSTESIDLAVVHRSVEEDAVGLIKTLLQVDPDLPIIVVSGSDRREAVLAAGAQGFMKYDEWLRVGEVVTTVLARD